jgi:hypothetical protein
MTLKIDGLRFDALTTDPGVPAEGDLWFNATDVVLRTRLDGITRTVGAKTIDFIFGSGTATSPWVEIGSGGNTVVARFVFRGSIVLGVPTSIKALVESDIGVTTQITIYDLTNANQIAQASSTATVPTILDLGTLANVSTGEAIVEIQVERVVGTGANRAKIGALSIYF